MADERVLRAILRFGVSGTAELKSNMDGVTASVVKMQQRLAELKSTRQAFLEAGESTDKFDQEIKKVTADLEQVKQASADVGLAITTAMDMRKLKRVGMEIEQISRSMVIVGGLLEAPFIKAAADYVKQAGKTEETSRKWLEATDDIHASYLRIGRVAAREILPSLEQAANLAERGARLVEQHPELVQAALTIGGGLIALGTFGVIAAQGIKLYADFKLISAAVLQNTAADKMLAAAGLQNKSALGGIGGGALGTAAAFAPIGIAGLAFGGAMGLGASRLSEALWSAILGKETLHKIQTGEQNAIGGLIGLALGSGARSLFTQLTNFMWGVNQGTTSGGSRGMGGGGEHEMEMLRVIPQRAVDAFVAYRESELKAEETYSSARIKLIRNTEERLTQNENSSRDKLQAAQIKEASAFARSEQQAQDVYYDERAKKARDFGITIERLEQDHQKQMKQLAADGNLRVMELAGQRDALGLARELRKNEKDRQKAEETYQKDISRRNADYALTLRDAEDNYKEERARRLDDFKQRQAEARDQLDEQLRDQRQAALQARDQTLADMQDSFNQQREARTAAFHDQLNQIDDHLTGEHDARLKWYAKMSADLEKWLQGMQGQFHSNLPGWPDTGTTMDSINTGTSGITGVPPVGYGPPHFQEGGYTPGGLIRAHAGEFVLNPSTTRAAERYAGGRLTQDRIMAQLASGQSGGGRGITVNFNGNYSGSFGEGDRAWVEQAVRDGATQVFVEAVRMAKAKR